MVALWAGPDRVEERATWFFLRFESSWRQAHNHNQGQCGCLPLFTPRRGSTGIFREGLWHVGPVLW